MKLLALLLLLAMPAKADNLAVAGPFTGLNNTDASIAIDPSEAQDALNVEVTQDGQSVIRRKGYSTYGDLPITTAPVYGSVHFITAAGDDIKVFAHDKYISKSVNGGAFTTMLSTMTAGSKWKFCSSDGSIYAFNDQHDTPWSWDGTTFTYYPSMPKASLCAMTVDRMLLSGTTDYPNRVYFSQSGDITNFVVGVEEEDPGFEAPGMPGDKITAIFTTQAEWLLFKRNSMMSYQGTNQYDLVPSVISERIGMTEPRAIVSLEGVVYFKGSDGKIYGYTAGTLTELTKKIDTFVSGITKDGTVIQSYTNKYEFDTGTYSETSGDTTAGSVEPKIYTYTDTTDADFNAGTVDVSLEVTDDKIYLASWGPGLTPTAGYFANMGAEVDATTNWTQTGLIPTRFSAATYYGSYFWRYDTNVGGSITLNIYKTDTDALVYTNTANSGQTKSLTVDMSSYEDTDYYIIFDHPYILSPSSWKSTNFRKGTLQVKMRGSYFIGGGNYAVDFDMYEEPPSVSTGTFISQLREVGAGQPIYGELVETSSITAGSSIDYTIAFATSTTGVLSNWQSTTTVWCSTCTYYKYRAVIEASTNTAVAPYIEDVSLKFFTTGYWETPEVSMGGMDSWGTFIAHDSLTGSATWTYEIFVATYAGGTASATAELLTNNVTITASTGTYSKVRATNYFASSTDTVRINDLSWKWSNTTDKMADAFEYKGDIYFSVPYNFSQTNNRVIKLDSKVMGWTIFDIPMNVPLSINDYVYFGSPTAGTVFQYPYGDSDNGGAINAYWQSKDYVGSDPYVEKVYNRISLIAGSNPGSTLDLTYQMDTSTSTSYSVDLTSNTASFLRDNRQLPSGERGAFFNLKFGNNAADQPWSFFGASVDYTRESWQAQ
jgi:hypothetical protein